MSLPVSTKGVPMVEKHTLIEPSFAAVLVAIDKATDLLPGKKRHWICSLGQIASALNKPPAMLPARWTAARFAIAPLHHARLGVTAKTLANHRSNARAALLWFADEYKLPRRGAPLTSAWQLLRAGLVDRHQRSVLSSLMHHCSAHGIDPGAVDEAVFNSYMQYRTQTASVAKSNTARRSIARVWNSCVGSVADWPTQRLVEPAIKVAEVPTSKDFPAGFHKDLEDYLSSLKTVRRGPMPARKRMRPCTDSTIKGRRAELMAAARMAVRIGIPIERLTALRALLDPDVSERILDAYWKKDGEQPSVYTIDLSMKFLAIARQIGCLDEKAVERLDDLRAGLQEHRRGGLTDKNLAIIRQVLSEGVWTEVIRLPHAMMVNARALQYHAPNKAAVMAQIAVAIAILSAAPVRLANLGRIKIGENLIKPGGPLGSYLLVFPDHDVKNRVQLEFAFDQRLTEMIDEYVHDFRPSLAGRCNQAWLFPGKAAGGKQLATLSDQITKRIMKATGLRLTAHQFRHAAAAIILKNIPGNYELVRRLLGHRNISTTTQFYCGLETTQAAEKFGGIIRDLMSFDNEDGKKGPTSRRGRRKAAMEPA